MINQLIDHIIVRFVVGVGAYVIQIHWLIVTFFVVLLPVVLVEFIHADLSIVVVVIVFRTKRGNIDMDCWVDAWKLKS